MINTIYNVGDTVEYTNIGGHVTNGIVESENGINVIKSTVYTYTEERFIRTVETYEQKWNREKMENVIETIESGKMYASVKKISASGMTRNISFYRVTEEGKIEDVTAVIGWLRGMVKVGEYVQGKSHVRDNGLKVGGFGMDMIFHTLYSCLSNEKASVWNQRYNVL